MNSPGNCFAIAVILVASCAPCSAQATKQKVKVYNTIVYTVFKGPAYRGILMEVTDTHLIMRSHGDEVRIPSNSIKQVGFKRKASVGRGAAIGGITGLVLGLAIGYSSGDDTCPSGSFCIYESTAEEKALAGGLVFCAGGTIVGVIIGAVSIAQKIKINGDLETFQSKQDEMKKYVFTLP